MAPIRTAIIGLSSTAVTGWASSAHLPYLLSARGKAKYQIVALCNSSVDAARAAIASYNLPPGTRAYGSPADLAKDPDVDLVVCNTRVDRHYETVRPSVEAGKAVFVEWPLAHGIEQARELASLARDKGGRSMVGLQGRFAPPVQKLREIVESGRIGKILSSEVKGAGGTNDREVIPEGLKYFAQRDIGGNVFTIGFGHLWEYVQSVVGEAQDIHGHLQLQRPDVKVRDLKTNTITGTTRSDVPDLIIAAASLEGTDRVQEGASLLVRFRRGQPFPGEAPLVWTINGEKGEIRLTAPGGTTLHAFAYAKPVIIEIHDFETDSVETVQWEWEQWREELPIPARSVAALYEAFAEGDEAKYPTFEHALGRHEQLEGILSRWSGRT